jgi:hypothetical protein
MLIQTDLNKLPLPRYIFKVSLVFCLLCISRTIHAQSEPDFKTGAFQEGEKLSYKAKYGFIHAAEVKLEVVDTKKEFNGKEVFHYVANGKTTSSFDFFMKVRHRYDSYVDRETFLPYQFTESVREGNYKRDGYANFDQKNNKIVATKGTFNAPNNTFDIISLYYFARCLDTKNLRVGEMLKLKFFLDDGIYPADIEYLGKETISTDAGKFECIKFSPSLQPGRVFRKDSRMYIWITNDANRIPVKVEVEILIGSVYIELEKYEGLKNPVTSRR